MKLDPAHSSTWVTIGSSFEDNEDQIGPTNRPVYACNV